MVPQKPAPVLDQNLATWLRNSPANNPTSSGKWRHAWGTILGADKDTMTLHSPLIAASRARQSPWLYAWLSDAPALPFSAFSQFVTARPPEVTQTWSPSDIHGIPIGKAVGGSWRHPKF